jgi:8-oxo-dGTP pyrophosphatase MutT (NUDIX family)
MPPIREIRSALSDYEPQLVTSGVERRAAVAMVLRAVPESGPEVLLIERAQKEGDPWSGHMAFPGGRMDPEDASEEHAARRETLEEVGVSLDPAEPLGRLDDLQGRHAGRPSGLVISAFVYHHPSPGRLIAEEKEVRSAFWVPLWSLADPDRHVKRAFRETGSMELPGIVVGEPDRHVIWGLTYRFIEVFYTAVRRPFPSAWGDVRAFGESPGGGSG